MSAALIRFVLIIVSILSASSVVAEEFTIIPMSQKHLATYYVQGTMKGIGDVEFMVDTGAGYTTINERVLEDLSAAGNVIYIGRLTGVLADGSERIMPVYRIKSLVLGTDCVLKNVDAAVFPSNTRMLLGLTALNKSITFCIFDKPSSA